MITRTTKSIQLKKTKTENNIRQRRKVGEDQQIRRRPVFKEDQLSKNFGQISRFENSNNFERGSTIDEDQDQHSETRTSFKEDQQSTETKINIRRLEQFKRRSTFDADQI